MPDQIVEEKRPRQGIGTRIYNYVMHVLNRHPRQIMRRRKSDDKTGKGFPGYLGDEGQNIYSFYGEKMRLGKTRMEVYDEIDAMDSDDLPGATLDTYTEDAVQQDPATGRIIWFEDCDDRIRKICEECWEKIQGEEFSYLMARSLAKYGDFPVEMYWEPGEGVNLLRFHHPKRFRRFEEMETGELLGFHLGDGAYGAQEPNTQPWEIVHFRVFGALSAMYGTTLLLSARRSYRRLRLSEDGDVVYRMQRHPDRDVFYVDCTGLTDQEASDYLERFRVGMKKQKYYDPSTGQLREDWNPYTVNEDLLVPQITGRETKIERLRGSNNANDATGLDWYLARYHASVRIPPAFFGYTIQGAQPYDPQKKLTHQDSRYAKIPAKLQRYLLLGIHRILQFNLAFKGIDPTDEANTFTVATCPVSYLDELHRQQLIEIRIDIIDRLLNMGSQVGFNMQLWVRYVLKQYGKLSEDLIEELMLGGGQPQVGGAGAPPGVPESPPPALPGPGGAEPVPPPPMDQPVGAQPGGNEFESLPSKIKSMLFELVHRLGDANKIVEDSRCTSERALRFYSKESTAILFGGLEEVNPSKSLREGLEANKYEDTQDLHPIDEEAEEG